MPQIPTYQDHVTAQGAINTQSNPNDFGAQVGVAMQNVGGALGYAADKVDEFATSQDVTNVHVNMAKARAEWTQNLQERERTATPGDDTFHTQLTKDMTDWFAKASDSAGTRKGKQLFATLAANMTSEFEQKAISIQAGLTGQAAANGYQSLKASMGTTVYNDETQLPTVLAQAKAAIDDPNSLYAKVPAPVRQQFKQELEKELNFAAAKGFVSRHPEVVLGSVAPDKLETFKPWDTLLQNNAAPGGKLTVSPGMMKWAPVVANAAALKGVNPNILMAMGDQESRGNDKAVGPVTASGEQASGLFQFMPGTAKAYGVNPQDGKSSAVGAATYMSDLLKQFGGDYTKALAAYNWGPGNLTNALQRWGADWQKHLPAETTDYVANIMTKSGMRAAPAVQNAIETGAPAPADPAALQQIQDNVLTTGGPNAEGVAPAAGPAPAPQATEKKPVDSTLPFFKALTWEQQDHVIQEGVKLQHMRVVMAEKAQADQEHAIKKQQEQIMGTYLEKIIDPITNGNFDEREILNDKRLTWSQQQHMIDYALTRTRELRAQAESKTNPAEVRRLMLQIHAADDDPTKAYNFDPIMDSYRAGAISTPEMKMLRNEVEQMRDGNGNNFQKRVHMARETAFAALVRSPIGQAMPEVAAEASYRFTADLDAQIEALRKQNKDPQVLLDPKSPSYLLAPERIKSFLNPASQAMAAGAQRVVAQELNGMQASHSTPVAQPQAKSLPSFEVGKSYKVNGKMRVYLGGATNLSSSWGE